MYIYIYMYIYTFTSVSVYLYIDICVCIISTTFSHEFADLLYLPTVPPSVPNSFGRQVLSSWQSRARLLCQLAQPAAWLSLSLSTLKCSAHICPDINVYLRVYVCINAYVYIYVCGMYVSMYVCMYVCVYVCMCVYIYVSILHYTHVYTSVSESKQYIPMTL